MLGLGDAHGKAAIEWTIDNLRMDFATVDQGQILQHTSSTDGKSIHFGNALGEHTAYRFHFADQHILRRTLQVPGVLMG